MTDTSVARRLVVWASPAQRAVATARDVPCKQLVTWKTLHQLDCGVCDGMTLDEVRAACAVGPSARAHALLRFARQFESKMPEEYYQRTRDKLRFRFPRGESYLDVKARLEPVIFELERQRNPVLVVRARAPTALPPRHRALADGVHRCRTVLCCAACIPTSWTCPRSACRTFPSPTAASFASRPRCVCAVAELPHAMEPHAHCTRCAA